MFYNKRKLRTMGVFSILTLLSTEAISNNKFNQDEINMELVASIDNGLFYQSEINPKQFFKDFITAKIEDKLGAILGVGFDYLMSQLGLNWSIDNTEEKLNQIIALLNKIEREIKVVQENQKIMRMYISDGFYNLHMRGYVAQLEKASYLLSYDQNSLHSSGSDITHSIRAVNILYAKFFNDIKADSKVDQSDITGYVVSNLISKEDLGSVSQDEVNEVVYLKDALVNLLKVNYLPAIIEKDLLLSAIKNDTSIDIARSIRFINSSISEVAFRYGMLMQKIYMVLEVLAVLQQKDPRYNVLDLGFSIKGKALNEILVQFEQEIDIQSTSFMNHIDHLLIKDKYDILRQINNLYFTANDSFEGGTIDKAVKQCELVSYIPISRYVRIDCSIDKASSKNNRTYPYTFSAYLGRLYDDGYISSHFVHFNYGDVANDERFNFKFTKQFENRIEARTYFSNASFRSINPLSTTAFAGWHGGKASVRWFDFHMDKNTYHYGTPTEEVVKYGERNYLFTPYTLNYATVTLVYIQKTGNFVLVNNDQESTSWAFGGIQSHMTTYISALNEDSSALKLTRVPSKLNKLENRRYAIQQGFLTGAAVVMEYSDGYDSHHPDTYDSHSESDIFTYNPLQVISNIHDHTEVIDLVGNWLQYCDRQSAKVTKVVNQDNQKDGWQLVVDCHENIENSEDFVRESLFINQALIDSVAKQADKTINVTYDPFRAIRLFVKNTN